MEEGQRPFIIMESSNNEVLILVVMEEGQRQYGGKNRQYCCYVLILVVMEEGQRLVAVQYGYTALCSLNPCCNGRGSKTTC